MRGAAFSRARAENEVCRTVAAKNLVFVYVFACGEFLAQLSAKRVGVAVCGGQCVYDCLCDALRQTERLTFAEKSSASWPNFAR